METPPTNPEGPQEYKSGGVWDALMPHRAGEAPQPAPERPAPAEAETEAPEFAVGEEVILAGERWHVAQLQGESVVIARQGLDGGQQSQLVEGRELRKVNPHTGADMPPAPPVVSAGPEVKAADDQQPPTTGGIADILRGK